MKTVIFKDQSYKKYAFKWDVICLHSNVFSWENISCCFLLYIFWPSESLHTFYSVLASSPGATADQSPHNCPFAAERSKDGNGEMSAGLAKCGPWWSLHEQIWRKTKAGLKLLKKCMNKNVKSSVGKNTLSST